MVDSWNFEIHPQTAGWEVFHRANNLNFRWVREIKAVKECFVIWFDLLMCIWNRIFLKIILLGLRDQMSLQQLRFNLISFAEMWPYQVSPGKNNQLSACCNIAERPPASSASWLKPWPSNKKTSHWTLPLITCHYSILFPVELALTLACTFCPCWENKSAPEVSQHARHR